MKKLASLILAAALLIPGLASCGNSNADDKTITVAATSTPHAEILEVCKPLLEEKGYTLDIKVVSDYVTPNQFTEDGEVDANYFQHQPYLDSFNEENKTHLVSVAQIHYEPFAIYRGTVDSLAALPDGASIAVPNDTTNEARALQLLAAQGLITLKDGVGLTATKNDITDNPHNYDIKEIFVDGIFRIAGADFDEFGLMLGKLDKLTGEDVTVAFTVSADNAELPSSVTKFLD